MRGDIKMKTNNFDLFEDLNLTEDERKVFDSRRETSTIIAKIIKRRMDLKMSQRDLAIKTGIKQPMIARIENGDSVPRIDTLIRIANELNLKIGFEKNDVILWNVCPNNQKIEKIDYSIKPTTNAETYSINTGSMIIS